MNMNFGRKFNLKLIINTRKKEEELREPKMKIANKSG